MESNWPFAVSKSTNHFWGKQKFRLTPPSVLLRCTLEFRQLGPMTRDGTRVILKEMCRSSVFFRIQSFEEKSSWRTYHTKSMLFWHYEDFQTFFPSSKLLASKRKKLHDKWNQVVFLKMFPSKMDKVSGLFFNSGCFFEDLPGSKITLSYGRCGHWSHTNQEWDMNSDVMSGVIDTFRFTWLQPVSHCLPFSAIPGLCRRILLSLHLKHCLWSLKNDQRNSPKKQTKSQKKHNQNQAWKPHRNFQKNANFQKKHTTPKKRHKVTHFFGPSLFF